MKEMKKELAVFAEKEDERERAIALAERLHIDCLTDYTQKENYSLLLLYGENGLELSDGKNRMVGDYTRLIPRLRENNLNGELIVKASGIKKLSRPCMAVDATAGMGEDSLLLAAAGFDVWLFEYDPIIAALLEDTLLRSREIPGLGDIVARMHLKQGNSIEEMGKLTFCPDMILLDPMFPQRSKSGLVKKKFQLLHHLEKPCDNEEDLLKAAMESGPGRIVIKRPAKGPFLAGVKPDFSLQGKAIRCDCILGRK